MNKFKGWQALYMSFFSGDLYKDVAQNWKGTGFLYLFLVIMGAWLVMAVACQIIINSMVDTYVAPVVAKWPTVKVANQKFSIDQPTPYVIETPNGFVIDFDTNSDEGKMPQGKTGVLINQTTIQMVDSSGAAKEMLDLKSLKTSSTAGGSDTASSSASAEFTLDKPTLQQVVELIKKWTGVVMFVVFGPTAFVFSIIQALIYAGIGMIVANSMNVPLKYGQVIRIAVVAMTPALLIETIARSAGHPIPAWGLIFMAMTIGFTIYGVRANASDAPSSSGA